MTDIVKKIYNRVVRPYLPRDSYRVCAGVAVQDHPPLDRTKRFPQYKEGLLSGIRDTVDKGDIVVLVASGRAVSTVHCLRAGASRVIGFEASSRMINTAKQTLEDNWTPDDCTVEMRHALVGEGINVYGDAEGADVVAPSELPEADVLVLDCEGAEKSILAGLDKLDSDFVIETHPERHVPPDEIRSELKRLGREWQERPYEPDFQKPVFVSD